MLLRSRSPRLSPATFIALASHVVRDASGGSAPVLWPVRGDVTIPAWVYYGGEVGLLCLAYVVGRGVA